MRHHIRDANLQEAGLHALLNFAAHAPANKMAISDEGGLCAVVAALRAHPDHAGVQEAGCGAFRNLGSLDTVKASIARAGGVELLLCALENHPFNATTQRNSCSALRNISSDVEIRSQIGRRGVLNVDRALANHPTNALVLEAACNLLRMLATSNTLRHMIVKNDMAAPVVAAMVGHPLVPGLQKAAAAALRNISGGTTYDQYVDYVWERRALPALRGALLTHASHAGVQRACARALVTLGRDEAHQTRLAQQDQEEGGDVMELLVRGMNLNMSSVDVQTAIIEALCVFVNHGALQESMVTHGAVGTLLEVGMRHRVLIDRSIFCLNNMRHHVMGWSAERLLYVGCFKGDSTCPLSRLAQHLIHHILCFACPACACKVLVRLKNSQQVGPT